MFQMHVILSKAKNLINFDNLDNLLDASLRLA